MQVICQRAVNMNDDTKAEFAQATTALQLALSKANVLQKLNHSGGLYAHRFSHVSHPDSRRAAGQYALLARRLHHVREMMCLLDRPFTDESVDEMVQNVDSALRGIMLLFSGCAARDEPTYSAVVAAEYVHSKFSQATALTLDPALEHFDWLVVETKSANKIAIKFPSPPTAPQPTPPVVAPTPSPWHMQQQWHMQQAQQVQPQQMWQPPQWHHQQQQPPRQGSQQQALQKRAGLMLLGN